MTTILTATEPTIAPKTINELQVTEREAREVAEAARETEWTSPSFLKELFGGNLRLDLIHPYPSADPEEAARARPFLEQLEAVLQRVDGDQIEREQAIEAADVFSRQSRRRIEALFGQIFQNEDVATYRFAQEVLKGEHRLLEAGLPSV